MHKYTTIYFFLSLILSLSTSCARKFDALSVDGVAISVDSLSAVEDSSIIAFIQPYKEDLEEEMNQIIGYSTKAMTKSTPEGYLNNLIADIVFTETKIFLKANEHNIKPDICLLNMGGLRADLPEGIITKRNIFEIMPFDNEIVVLTLGVEQMENLFNYIAKNEGMPLAGASMGIKNGKAVNIMIDGQSFKNDNKEIYHVVTSDYLADGNDKMYFFLNAKSRINTYYLMRDAIINYIQAQQNKDKEIDTQLDKRIYFE